MGMSLSACSGCSKGLQEKALHQHALDMCGTMTHQSGNSCRSEVERRFPQCSRPFLAKKISSEAYAECLGFVVPNNTYGSSTVVGQCDAPNISATISVSLAKNAPWDGAATRVINGQTLYVSNTPTISTRDIRTLRLEEHDGDRLVAVEVSEEAARRLEATTRDNIGESMILALNESVVAPRIASAIPGPKLVMTAPDARIQDLCRAP
jgi:hypothetical protein